MNDKDETCELNILYCTLTCSRHLRAWLAMRYPGPSGTRLSQFASYLYGHSTVSHAVRREVSRFVANPNRFSNHYNNDTRSAGNAVDYRFGIR